MFGSFFLISGTQFMEECFMSLFDSLDSTQEAGLHLTRRFLLGHTNASPLVTEFLLASQRARVAASNRRARSKGVLAGLVKAQIALTRRQS